MNKYNTAINNISDELTFRAEYKLVLSMLRQCFHQGEASVVGNVDKRALN